MFIEIRPVNVNDAQDILNIYQYYIINTTITFEYDVPTLSSFQERIKNITKNYPYFVAVHQGKIIGYAYSNRFKERKAFDWSCEVSIYVDKNYQHQGVGKQLYQKLFTVLKELNYHSLFAFITYPNLSSEKFHYSLGFKRVGYYPKAGYKFNQWCDLIVLEKNIQDVNEVLNIIPFTEWEKDKQ